MSDANIIHLQKRFEKTPPLDELRNCFASTRETLELLNAFLRIENPIYPQHDHQDGAGGRFCGANASGGHIKSGHLDFRSSPIASKGGQHPS
jgi:hypothetical protein